MAIDEDYGKLLAALMKKDFIKMTGIDFIAVGGGGAAGQAEFKKDVKALFKELKDAPLKLEGGRWVWAKRILPEEISYLDEQDKVVKTVTRKIRVEVSFDKGVPPKESLDFSRFALLAIDSPKEGLFNPEMMFFIDYVTHDPITKDETTKLVRDIVIDFPVKELK
jgi:hypothetical protein